MEIAVCIPAYNEAITIGKVVNDFKKALPDATVYVYDNNSPDKTNEIASASGAIVRKVRRQGKGTVIKRMLADIEADIYVMADGDNAHDHIVAPTLVKKLIQNNLDMVVGARLTAGQSEFKKGHYEGNLFFSKLVSILFSAEIKDLLSGYRVLSQPFVKSFAASSKGFEIESEMTIHCLVLNLPFSEVNTKCKCRSQKSKSKLQPASDGLRILLKIILLLKDSKPFLFFGFISLLLFFSGVILLLPVLVEYFKTGLTPQFPSLIVSTGLVVLSIFYLISGITLQTTSTHHLETKKSCHLFYKNKSLSDLEGPVEYQTIINDQD